MAQGKQDFLAVTAETLAIAAKAGDAGASTALIARMMPLVRHRASSFRAIGADADDLVQEGLVGLLFAIRSFVPTREASFQTYASVCVSNRLRSAVKAAARQKHRPLNMYVSLSDAGASIADAMPGPEEQFFALEQEAKLNQFLQAELSAFESEVLTCYLGGQSYEQAAHTLGSTAKSVDNALQRVRRKLRSYQSS